MKKIWISIINYNGKADTLECLESLDKLETHNMELSVFVVDNNSKEKFEIPKSLFKKIAPSIIHSSENKGFSGGHNLVIQKAIGENVEYIIILNNDTYTDKKFVQELVAVIEKDSSIGVVAPKIYFAKGHEFHKNRYKNTELGKVIWYAGGVMDWDNVLGSHLGVDEVDGGQFEEEIETDFGSGCCILLNVSALKKVGGFDERYFLYYEDNDLQERLKRSKYKIFFCPKAIIWHKNAGSVGGSGSVLQDYFISRNRMLFGLTYATWKTRFALIRESFVLLLSGRQYQKKGIADFYKGRFGKGSFFNE